MALSAHLSWTHLFFLIVMEREQLTLLLLLLFCREKNSNLLKVLWFHLFLLTSPYRSFEFSSRKIELLLIIKTKCYIVLRSKLKNTRQKNRLLVLPQTWQQKTLKWNKFTLIVTLLCSVACPLSTWFSLTYSGDITHSLCFLWRHTQMKLDDSKWHHLLR